MKSIEKQMDNMKPLFEEGGKLEKLYPLFEAQDTFMLTPADVTDGPTHVRDSVDLKRVMIMVVLALMPCFLFGIYNAGFQYNYTSGVVDAGFMDHCLRGLILVMPIVLVSYIAGGVWEVLFAVVRKHEINEGFLVTGLLFPLTLPPTIPLWQVAVGISFGVVIGKEIFGGTGYNILNPALTARAFLFFAYPKEISGEVWTAIKSGAAPIDGWTAATPLGIAASVGPAPEGVVPRDFLLGKLQEAGYTLQSMFGGLEGGSIAETAALPILIGAAILIISGVGSWKIMVGGFAGLAIGAFLLNTLAPASATAFTALPFMHHVVIGSFLFGIVFMATDPVSASATETGKWIYGIMIGLLTTLIRVTNPAYPEGVMLSILFMNVMAPLIDHFVVQAHIKKRTAHIRKFSYAKG